MKDDKFFFVSIVVSLLIHALLLIKLSITNSHYLKNPLQKVEVVYQGQHKTSKPATPNLKSQSLAQKHLEKDAKVLFKKHTVPEQLVKDTAKFSGKLETHKKSPLKSPSLAVKRRVSIPVFKSDKMDNSKYMSYRIKIRESIQSKILAYLESDTVELNLGEVYVSFVLLSDGTLKQVKIVEDKSSADAYLREISLKSVKNNVFPSFPSGLNYPELSIGVVISVENDE